MQELMSKQQQQHEQQLQQQQQQQYTMQRQMLHQSMMQQHKYGMAPVGMFKIGRSSQLFLLWLLQSSQLHMGVPSAPCVTSMMLQSYPSLRLKGSVSAAKLLLLPVQLMRSSSCAQ
jgi:hypothetical protein